MKALANQEFEKTIDLVLTLAPILPVVELAPIREEMVRSLRAWHLLTPIKAIPFHEKSLTDAILNVVKIMTDNRIMVTWGFLKIDRTWATMDASMNYLIPQINYPKLSQRYFRKRERRVLRQQLKLRSIKEMLQEAQENIAEYSIFIDPVIRKAVHTFEGDISKVGHIFTFIFDILTTAAFLGGIFLILTYFYTFYRTLFNWLDNLVQNAALLREAFQIMQGFGERFGPDLWLLLIIIDIYLWIKFRRTRRRMAAREVRLPRGSEG